MSGQPDEEILCLDSLPLLCVRKSYNVLGLTGRVINIGTRQGGCHTLS